MKKRYFIPFICILLLSVCSCSKSKALEGNWETTALIKEGVAQEIAVSNINFVMERKQLMAKGLAGVNLYYANIKIKGKNFKAFGMENTGFNGTPAEMEFEDLFFDALMNSNCYKIKGDTLYIFDRENSRKLQLKRKPLVK